MSGSTEKSRRAAASAGSLIRYVTVACTVTSWKSAVRAWKAMASSRSSTGTSESAAVSDRYQKLSPGPVVGEPAALVVADVGGGR